MRFTVEHPSGQHGCAADLYGPGGMAAVAQTAEAAGFDAIAFTEHRVPPRRWVGSGGHPSMEPFAALAFCAGVTSRVVLQTRLNVSPNHPPLLLARTAAALDRLSRGRLVLGVRSGYLREEFAALGVDFDRHNEQFDDALAVLRTVLDGEEFSYASDHVDARSVLSERPPVQLPHPPLWFAGSSPIARRRVARIGQGWMVLLRRDRLVSATRCGGISTPSGLAGAIRELRFLLEQQGRDPESVHVQVFSAESCIASPANASVEQHVDFLGALAEAGADWFVVRPPASAISACCEALHDYGVQVIARVR